MCDDLRSLNRHTRFSALFVALYASREPKDFRVHLIWRQPSASLGDQPSTSGASSWRASGIGHGDGLGHGLGHKVLVLAEKLADEIKDEYRALAMETAELPNTVAARL